MRTILIVEDDLTFSKILSGFLVKKGYTPFVVRNLQEARQFVCQQHCDLILLDYRLPDGTGIDFLEYMQKQRLSLSAIIMTSFHDVRTAVQSIKKGAIDYITKPINHEELLMRIEEGIRGTSSKDTVTTGEDHFVQGVSEMSRQLQQYIDLVAPTDMSVLIQGESGTGKEHVARMLHFKSKRSKAPFVAIDCGVLSPELAASELFGHVKGAFTGALHDKKGQFEYANGGTLFLDEVGNLDYQVQVKLLRAIQEREMSPVGGHKTIPFDVRIITATNEDFQEIIKRSGFREDLYHRINEFKIRLPSLSERKEDMDEFVDFFIRMANEELHKQVRGASDELKEVFRSYDWPGNIRELKNIVKRAVLLTRSDIIGTEHLPEEMELFMHEKTLAVNSNADQSTDLKEIQANTEKELILKTLQEVKYNKSKAARLLNIDRTTLYNKMNKYNIEG